jgi:large subunit ribosomal protein L18
MGASSRREARERRQKRVRRKIRGKPERPRLCVFRSGKHMYAQIIDDQSSMTLVEASSVSKELRDQIGSKGGNKDGAATVGTAIARRAISKGIKQVVFDRNGFLYHGRVKALSDAAREGGLEF